MFKMNASEPDTPFIPLDSSNVLREALARSADEPVVLFKHSISCGISSFVRRRLHALTEPDDPPVYELIVQTARSLSNELSSSFGIQHESPQIIIVHKQQAVFDTSHGRITAQVIRDAVGEAISI